MKISARGYISRRGFLKSSTAALTLAAIPDYGKIFGGFKKRNKMILSFYMDDTNPEIVKAETFKYFLDYCNGFGIKGESSVILGYNGKSITDDPDDNQRIYAWQARHAFERGIDSHMEIMTHSTLFDFRNGAKNESGIHEGLWLHEPGIKEEEYRAYFSAILEDGEKSGIKFTGLTWPGCSCEACTKRYAELKSAGPLHINQAAFNALLSLSKDGKFRGRVLPVFYEASETDYAIHRRAAEGKYGVYDLMPNCMDNFGIWENSEDHVNPDYYITDDGKSGIIMRHLADNAPYCMWYQHWQGVNPEKGLGWKAFQTVTERIKEHLSDKVIWMRPSDIVTAFHDAGGWSFTEDL